MSLRAGLLAGRLVGRRFLAGPLRGEMRGAAGQHAARAVAALGVVAVAVTLAACGSTRHGASTATSATAPAVPARTAPAPSTPVLTPPAPATPATTVAGQLPTAPDCGGGAYQPATLLIVCASGAAAVSASGVTWRSWGPAAAVGSGTVHLVVHGRPIAQAATFIITAVRAGPVGPQFTQLVITWTGPSPTGSPRASYQLQPGG